MASLMTRTLYRNAKDVDGGIELTMMSSFTGKMNTLKIEGVNLSDYTKWLFGELGLIQNAFPHLDKDTREFMMSGATKEEWDKVFGNDDHDLENDEEGD